MAAPPPAGRGLGRRASSRRKSTRAAKPPARKPRPRPKPAIAPGLTWDALAVALGTNVRRIHRLRLEAGAPTEADLDAWRVFVNTRIEPAPAERMRSANELAREAADLRFAEARARQAERDDAIAAGQVVTKEQAREAAGLVRDAFLTAGEALPAIVVGLLPRFGKSERQAVEDAVRAAWGAELERIAAGGPRG